MPAAVCPWDDTARMAPATACARTSGVAWAVLSKWRGTASISAGSASGSRSASLSIKRVIAIASATTSRMPARSSRLVVARAVRPSITGLTESWVLRSLTF